MAGLPECYHRLLKTLESQPTDTFSVDAIGDMFNQGDVNESVILLILQDTLEGVA